MSDGDLSDFSMQDLFRLEAEGQAQVLTAGLLVLERKPTAADQLEACMRAAHSLKGAARIVDRGAAVRVAHAMEDCFVAAQNGRLILHQEAIDLLLRGVDLLTRIAQAPDEAAAAWNEAGNAEINDFLTALKQVLAEPEEAAAAPAAAPVPPVAAPAEAPPRAPEPEPGAADRVLRVTADNLNRLLALAGESLVESRWLKTFADSLLRLKRMHQELGRSVGVLRGAVADAALGEDARIAQAEVQRRVLECQDQLAQRLAELDMFDRRSANLSHRLYDEALAVRMRPFADGIQSFARLVRDVGRTLGKQARLEIIGDTTQVDRDILDKLEAPLGHLLRNALDHGLETPAERAAAGKPAEGTVTLEARHSAGMLQITVSDDGRGIDLPRLREAVVTRKLTNAETAAQLSEPELLAFLFLPGFSLREQVTEISGRGVGLDVVQNMVKQVRGTVRVSARPGGGTRFQLQLPLTLSVVRTLLVSIGGEPYALPLAHIVRTLKLPAAQIELVEGRQHFRFEGQQIGLVAARQILGGAAAAQAETAQPVIVVKNATDLHGLAVDRFLGERELVVQPLDARLGKIKDIAAGALMEDGSPVLIIDVEDMILSVEKLVTAGRLDKVSQGAGAARKEQRKRVLVVDDSLTVRELERKLLDSHGYQVEVAVDGMEGWNTVRGGRFDLVVTDIDMPRMDGFELVTLIKRDPGLKALPVMIVSYKDREEDRRRGLEAGADYYLTKGSFHDETLLQAVVDLIGAARP
jgi:two-component system sensor histidine kinase and response regulator WspE